MFAVTSPGTATIADCSFENDHTCGWTPANEGEWLPTTTTGGGLSSAALANDAHFADTYLEGRYKDKW